MSALSQYSDLLSTQGRAYEAEGTSFESISRVHAAILLHLQAVESKCNLFGTFGSDVIFNNLYYVRVFGLVSQTNSLRKSVDE
jgi:hypothetical protein